MRRVADCDSVAFETVYRRHVDHVIRTATARCTDPHEVGDVVADTFLAVWRSAHAKPVPCQVFGDDLAQIDLVVDDEDFGGNGHVTAADGAGVP